MNIHPRRLLEMARAERAQARNYVPHEPFQKQADFMALDCLEALYGGAAGGGKSDTLLMDAAQFCHIPGYSALTLRRTHAELILEGALLDRSHDWWDNTPVHWNGEEKRWTWPSGASIQFGYFDSWTDRSRYQSAAWNRVYFDELTHFPERWYRFLFTRIRRIAGFPVPSGMRGGTNPGNVGHRWVMDRFPVLVPFEQQDPKKRRFMPANFRDNPHIDQDDYEQTLAEADPITRRQMLGEWIEDGVGRVYGGFDRKRNLIDELPPGGDWTYLLGFDFGVTKPNAISLVGWRKHDRMLYVLQSYRKKGDPIDMAEEAIEIQRATPLSRLVGDVGGLGKGFTEVMTERYNIPIEPADKANKKGYIKLINGELAKGRIVLLKDTCEDLISEWESLQWDETGEKETPGMPNHAADSCLYAWRASTAYGERTEMPAVVLTREEKIRRDTDEHFQRKEQEIQQQLRAEQEEYGGQYEWIAERIASE